MYCAEAWPGTVQSLCSRKRPVYQCPRPTHISLKNQAIPVQRGGIQVFLCCFVFVHDTFYYFLIVDENENVQIVCVQSLSLVDGSFRVLYKTPKYTLSSSRLTSCPASAIKTVFVNYEH